MSGGAGPIIIRRNLRTTSEAGSVMDQLSATKLAKLNAVLSKDEAEWTHKETKFVIHCIRDALECYES